MRKRTLIKKYKKIYSSSKRVLKGQSLTRENIPEPKNTEDVEMPLWQANQYL